MALRTEVILGSTATGMNFEGAFMIDLGFEFGVEGGGDDGLGGISKAFLGGGENAAGGATRGAAIPRDLAVGDSRYEMVDSINA